MHSDIPFRNVPDYVSVETLGGVPGVVMLDDGYRLHPRHKRFSLSKTEAMEEHVDRRASRVASSRVACLRCGMPRLPGKHIRTSSV